MLKQYFASLVIVPFLSACMTAPGNYLDTSRLKEQSSVQTAEVYPVKAIDGELIVEQTRSRAEVERAQRATVDQLASSGRYVYYVQPQDILGVTVWDHPELTTPTITSFSSGGNTTQTLAATLQQPYTTALPGQADPYGQTVAADGTIFIPFSGRLQVAGKTVGQIRDQVAMSLVRFVRNPQVDIRVLSFRSQKVQVTGQVKTPGPLAVSDVPLTLVDAITRSGGTTTDADLQRIRLVRKKQLYVLDANRMLDRGDEPRGFAAKTVDLRQSSNAGLYTISKHIVLDQVFVIFVVLDRMWTRSDH